jgi:transposase-like protein
MVLNIDRKDNRFRLITQSFCTSWFPDTAANRKVALVFLRLLTDVSGKPLFTLQQLSCIVLSDNRQAASQHLQDFRACGCDFKSLVTRRRKVSEEVVSTLKEQLLSNPLATISELRESVNHRLQRNDLSNANIKAALQQMPASDLRVSISRKMQTGKAHYKEEYLLHEMMQTVASESGKKAGITPSLSDGMKLSDPTAIRSLLTANAPLQSIGNPLKWVIFMMTLYYHGLPLSLLGRWFAVHKTTILRWVISLALSLWPMVFSWLNQSVSGKMVYLDEKWLKIKGKWYYWFVVLDQQTGLPVITSLLASKTKWSLRWIGYQLKQLKKLPTVLITDGMLGYDCLANLDRRIQHLLCHFHHQQGVTRYLKKNFKDKQIPKRKQAMKQVLQTKDKRTVTRRLEKLKQKARQLGIQTWVKDTEKKLPKLLPAVGSRRIPTTNNAIERFFRAFNRFYKLRCGFFSILSAKREIIFFILMYLFLKQPETGKAPLEAILPQVREMPFYQIVNDPIMILMKTESVKHRGIMADFALTEKLLE